MKTNHLNAKVLDYLMNSGFASGETVREIDLARRFNVSHTPIREILNSLEAKGFVERRKRKGTYLKPVSLKELNETYEVRAVMEGLAARLFCGVATAEVVRELKKTHRQYEKNKPGRNRKVLSEIDLRFHSLIVDSCRNRKVSRLVKDFHIISKSFRRINDVEEVLESEFKNPYTHLKIIEAIEKNKPGEAERLGRRHVEWAKENMIKNLLMEGIGRVG